MTLPDRVLDLVVRNSGTLVATAGKVEAAIAEALDENATNVRNAVDVLVRDRLVMRADAGRRIESTELGFRIWCDTHETNREGLTMASEFTFEAVPPERFPMNRGGSRSLGKRIIDAFLDSKLASSKVQGLKTEAKRAKNSIDSFLRKEGRTKEILVRVVDDELWLARADQIGRENGKRSA